MNNQTIIEKNLEQYSLFMNYALEHPEILEKISDNAEIVFLPENDKELTEINLKTAKAKGKVGKKVIYMKVKVTPQTRTVLIPQVELMTP